jgi:hypothetical protein
VSASSKQIITQGENLSGRRPLVRDVGTIGQQHIGYRVPILVLGEGLKRDFLSKDQG